MADAKEVGGLYSGAPTWRDPPAIAERLPYVAALGQLLQDAVGRTFTPAYERLDFADMNEVARAYGLEVVFDGAILHVVRRHARRHMLVFAGVEGNTIVSYSYQGDVHSTVEPTNAEREQSMRQSHHDIVEAAAHKLRQLIAASPAETLAEMLELAHGVLAADLPFDLAERCAVQWLQTADRKR